jgi:CheY-like chemotaxis protein
MNSDYTLLIVDDIEENIEILDRQLIKEGFKTLTTNESSQALELLKNYDIDLVLLDINMPVIDGITLLSNIKEDKSLDNIAVIMVTANDDINTALECLKKGACGYITKPYDLTLLKTQMSRCLDVTIT